MSRDLADFYRRYPYPKVDRVEYDRNIHDHLRYLAHACYDNPAARRSGRRARMLIAGCGTWRRCSGARRSPTSTWTQWT